MFFGASRGLSNVGRPGAKRRRPDRGNPTRRRRRSNREGWWGANLAPGLGRERRRPPTRVSRLARAANSSLRLGSDRNPVVHKHGRVKKRCPRGRAIPADFAGAPEKLVTSLQPARARVIGRSRTLQTSRWLSKQWTCSGFGFIACRRAHAGAVGPFGKRGFRRCGWPKLVRGRRQAGTGADSNRRLSGPAATIQPGRVTERHAARAGNGHEKNSSAPSRGSRSGLTSTSEVMRGRDRPPPARRCGPGSG